MEGGYFSKQNPDMTIKPNENNVSHSIHVWYIYLHLVDFHSICIYMQVNIPYMDPMGFFTLQ